MCEAHQADPKLGDRLRRLGYYQPKMIPDAIAHAKQCHTCQIHGDFIHQAPGYLCPTTSSWPFETWGMDAVCPISPPSSKGHQFILTITDYFFKRAEAIPLMEVKTSDVIKFIKYHVIYRFGVPHGLSMTMGLSSSAKHSNNSAISLGSRVCLQWHTIQLLTALQKLSTRPFENFSRNSSRRANATGTISQMNAYGLITQQ